jgi:hypothetical protein
MAPIVVWDYDELKKLLNVLGSEAKFVYFRGNDLENNLSWCPDCQICEILNDYFTYLELLADENVKAKLDELKLSGQTIICNVGFKET